MKFFAARKKKTGERKMSQIQSVTQATRKKPSASISKRITWGAVIIPLPDCGVPQARATAVLFRVFAFRFVTGPKEKRKIESNDAV